MSDPNAILLPNKEMRQNDNKWIHLQGWRFIHHPKVKENRCDKRNPPTDIWLGACATRTSNKRNSLDFSIR